MLFNSWIFIAAFLPVTLCGYYLLLRRAAQEVALAWLVLASLFFYAWFDAFYLVILLGSVAFNYTAGQILSHDDWPPRMRRHLLAASVVANLGALFYFKYTGLFFETLNFAGGHFTAPEILLPIGISFFTFQQIAWLVDSYRRETTEPDFLRYMLFVTFFPQLVAGPIVHHKQIIPQFLARASSRVDWQLFAAGVTMFTMGLFKKTCIADPLADIANPVFLAATAGTPLTLAHAWLGPAAYAMQIYFDFSGYSDMAIGIGAMFGVRLPLNFYAPYQAASIIDFWRRWHITLSRFLRDYLYIPLGGRHKGPGRRYMNFFITMLAGGLWHGASWTFALWGGMHGVFLLLNHVWRTNGMKMPVLPGRILTLLAVLIGWVLFRAENMHSATNLFSAMAFHGAEAADGIDFDTLHYALFAAAAAICLFLPPAHLVMGRQIALDDTRAAADSARTRFRWSPAPVWAIGIAIMAGLSLLRLNEVSPFIYFQF